MNTRLIRSALVWITILAVGCASGQMTRVAVPSYDYKTLPKDKTVFVTTKDKEIYEMTGVTVTETHIKGHRIVRDSFGSVVGRPETEISLEEVELVEVEKEVKEDNAAKVSLWILAGVGVVALTVLVGCLVGTLVNR
jgi:cobalamin biosynthesis Mg chelatase CobN